MNKIKLYIFFICYILLNSTGGLFSQETKTNVTEKKFEPNFQEKYKDAEFIYETKINTDQLSAWDKFWSAVGDFFRRLFDFTGEKTNFSAIEIIFKIIAIAIICFVVFMIVKIIIKNNGGFIFGKKNKAITTSDFHEEDIHSINFSETISQAKLNKEFRVAIRYYYLWLLKTYTDKEIIEWDIEKTNRDYANEINSLVTKDQFRYLSYLYDYIWYGEFSIDESDFKKAENKFLSAIHE